MSKLCLLLVGVSFVTLPVGQLSAQGTSDSSWSFNVENDGFWLKNRNEDRNYTMGVTWQVFGDDIASWALARPRAWLDDLLLPDRIRMPDSPDVQHRIAIGVSAFTPDDLSLRAPDPTDRPYASMLYMDSQRRALRPNGDLAVSTELSIGIYGLSIAKGFQRWVHRQRQDSRGIPVIPEGWDNQVSDGGEPTLRYTLRAQRKLLCRRNFDSQFTTEGSVGYYTNLGAGATARLGKLSSEWWKFDAKKVNQQEIPDLDASSGPSSPNCTGGPSGRWEAYLWASANAHLWAYNGMMQGQFRDSAVRVSASDMERLVYSYSGGATFGFRGDSRWYTFGMAVMFRSPEADLPQRRSHTWGGVYFAISSAP